MCIPLLTTSIVRHCTNNRLCCQYDCDWSNVNAANASRRGARAAARHRSRSRCGDDPNRTILPPCNRYKSQQGSIALQSRYLQYSGLLLGPTSRTVDDYLQRAFVILPRNIPNHDVPAGHRRPQCNGRTHTNTRTFLARRTLK